MSHYRRLGEDYTFKVGEKVWVVLYEAPHNWPDGYAWEGEITAVYDKADATTNYKHLRAKITDVRLKHAHDTVDVLIPFGSEPFQSYEVYPRGGTHVDTLIALIEKMSVDARTTAHENALRTGAVRELFLSLFTGNARKSAEAAYTQGVRDEQVKAEAKAAAKEKS